MSHFTVLVKVKPGEDLDALLTPYQENNMGDCPQEYMEFVSVQEEYLGGYETETIKVFVDTEGNPHEKYSPKFRDSGYACPAGWTEKEIPIKSKYPTFAQFMEEYHGYTDTDPETGEYGRWENPNAKWDWYMEGGRWPTLLEGTYYRSGAWFKENAARHKQEALEKARDFVATYNLSLDSGKFVDLDEDIIWGSSVRRTALDHGFVECKNESELTDEDRKCVLIPWSQSTRYDVCKPLPNGWATENWNKFLSISTFATLGSDRGWVERGSMGWFGCSSTTPDSQESYANSFLGWLYESDDDDVFVVVDCHI